MAIITTYKCDKCGKEWIPGAKGSENEQPVAVSLGFDFGKTEVRYKVQPDVMLTKMWCRECVVSLGMYAPTNKAEKATAPVELTFEQKVIILFEELGFRQAE